MGGPIRTGSVRAFIDGVGRREVKRGRLTPAASAGQHLSPFEPGPVPMDERPDPAPLPAADEELDTSGLRCPEPLMLLRNRMRGLGGGTVLRVVSTDPASVRDFEQFCHFLGHDILHRSDAGGRHEFLIRKGTRAGGEGP